MDKMLEPGVFARRLLLRRALSAGVVVVIASRAFAAAPEGPQVVIDNFTFSPTPLTVKLGATVTWMNRDDMPHSVVFPTLKLKSPPMDTDESFSHTFDAAGTFDYVCGLHPFMHGQVVVQA
jgi:amicyanin